MDLGTEIFNVVEFRNPDFVIAEDKHGKFVLTPENPTFQPLEPRFPKRCLLTTPRQKISIPIYAA